MKIVLTQEELIKMVKEHLFSGKEVSIEVEIVGQEVLQVKQTSNPWIKNTQTDNYHPHNLTANQRIVTKWSDNDYLEGSASHWQGGWNTLNESAHITEYFVLS